MSTAMRSRHGSMIIYCLGLATVLVVIAFGFLRAARSDLTAGDASTRIELAESAARMGLAHAVEQIVRDQATTTIAVATASGTVTATPAPTFLDGPYRSPFVSLTRPNEIVNVDHNQPASGSVAAEPDDVRAEDPVVLPLLRTGDSGDGWFTWFRPYNDGEYKGNAEYDGRGRYLEPEFTNTTRPDPGVDARPVAEVRFTDWNPPLPQRAQGLFLDRTYCRIATGAVLDDRVAARYRLRYAVGVEDLGGHLLTNPDSTRDAVWPGPGGMVGSWRDPAAAYRDPPAWLAGAQHAWYNMARRFTVSGPTSALRFEHVFLGRGNSVSADRSPATGFPVAFPGMLRNRAETAPGSGTPTRWWGYYSTALGIEPDGLYPGTTQAGGQYLGLGGANESEPLVLGGYGPSLSWIQQFYAQRGDLPIGADSPVSNDTATDWGVNTFATTPYGQRLMQAGGPPATWRWYQGRVDTPWYVNLLTAAPYAVDSMIWAYLPPGTRLLIYTRERYYEYALDANGVDSWNLASSIGNVTYTLPTPMRWGISQRDLFTSLSGPAFQHYAPPASPGLDPDFQHADSRPPAQRYPGALWWAADDLGKDIDVNASASIGKCSKTGQAFFAFPVVGTMIQRQAGGWRNPSPPAGFDEDKDLYGWDCGWGGVDAFKIVDSYYADLISAFTQSIAVVRAAWTQYPCRAFTPTATTISPALWDATTCTTLEQVDRIFLRQLGENFASPGDGIPLAAVRLGDTKNFAQTYTAGAYTPNATIRTLVVAGTIDARQANVMERVLNDWRMSFLGAGPQYSETFRPLDFSGDGQVHCSAYDQNPGASTADADDGVAWWKPVDAAVGAGRGPVPDHWFSVSGCFYIGKSHHFRIFARGELFDNLVQKPVADATLESVVASDPEGTAPKDLRVLFQRWHYNRYTGELPRQLE